MLAELPVAPDAEHIDADPRSGYVYVVSSQPPMSTDSYVTVLRGTEVVTTMVFSDSRLYDLVIEPKTGYAYLFESINDDLIVIGPEYQPPTAVFYLPVLWKHKGQ
jgi:DNA-binding beta-propeller fold protein YncE